MCYSNDRKLSPEKKPQVSYINNKSSTKKTIKVSISLHIYMKISCLFCFLQKKRDTIKIKELKNNNNNNMPKKLINEKHINESISFDIGL